MQLWFLGYMNWSFKSFSLIKLWMQNWVSTQTRPKHHLLVPSQYMGGRPWVKGIRGCDLAVGRKRESILGFQLKLRWGKMSCLDESSENKEGWEIRQAIFFWEWGMVQSTQCNGSGWVAGKPVGSLEKTPTTSQKRVRGKNGKSFHGKQYKR